MKILFIISDVEGGNDDLSPVDIKVMRLGEPDGSEDKDSNTAANAVAISIEKLLDEHQAKADAFVKETLLSAAARQCH
jgi:hypothetical protein